MYASQSKKSDILALIQKHQQDNNRIVPVTAKLYKDSETQCYQPNRVELFTFEGEMETD